MKDLLIGVLAAATGIYVEKKYHVSEKVIEQVKKYTGKDLFGDDCQDVEAEEI